MATWRSLVVMVKVNVGNVDLVSPAMGNVGNGNVDLSINLGYQPKLSIYQPKLSIYLSA